MMRTSGSVSLKIFAKLVIIFCANRYDYGICLQ